MRQKRVRAALALGGAMVMAPLDGASGIVFDQRPPRDLNVAPEPGQLRPALLRSRIYAAFDADDAAAAELLQQYLERFPDDGLMLYNAACAQARLGELDRAEQFLRQAMAAGYIDTSHFRRDPDMVPLRDRPVLKAIFAARDAADKLLAERAIEQWRAAHGDDYLLTTDEQRRINLITALDEVVHTQLMLRVQRQADHLAEHLFGGPLRHFVLVALASERDSNMIFENPGVSGHYHHGGRRLIVADVEPSMPHELVHAFHNSHMDRLGHDHPIWIREGLATLYETYRFGDDLAIDYVTNDRDVLVASLEQRDALVGWRDLFAMDTRQFKFRADERYAQVRTIFMYLADRGLLRTWYRTYTDRYAEDRSGVLAFETVFDRPLEETEAAWKRWIRTRSLDQTRVVLGMLPTSMPVITADLPDDLPATEAIAPTRLGSPEPVVEEPRRPEPAEQAFRRGRAAYSAGEYRRAVELFREVIEVVPDDADAHYELGLVFIRLGDLPSARAQLRTLSQLDPSLASLLSNLVDRSRREEASAPRAEEPQAPVVDPMLRAIAPGPSRAPRATCLPQRGCPRLPVLP
jgi:tetratricopeptide (TPR) repeat protein